MWTESQPLSTPTVREGGFYDVEAVRKDFPILEQEHEGKPVAYLDNAASTQVPTPVLDAMREVNERHYANVHRGVYRFSEMTTRAYESARDQVRSLLGARDAREIVFVRGATEGINLVAEGLGRTWLQPGDEVVISEMEHHANIVPWQRLRDERGIRLRVVGITDEGELDVERFGQVLGKRTRLVAVTHVSNTLGTINPLRQIVRMARDVGAWVLVDGAQAVPHLHVDVVDLDCDFYVFSGHKTYGPTGIGAVYGKMDRLEQLAPYQLGGDMIRSVSFEKTTFAPVPQRFEAGTPNIVGAVGLAEAIRYLRRVGIDAIGSHERALLQHATRELGEIPGARIQGRAGNKAAVLSFTIDGLHPHDIGTILDAEAVAVRAGHHCTQPLMQRLGVPATTRASFGIYNTHQEVRALGDALRTAWEVLR